MKNKKIRMLLLAIVLSISCFLTCFVPATNVYASSIGVVGGYTNVLEDLQKDDTFNANDYPVIQDDYSLQLITIAESCYNELFVYVYQPSANYKHFVASHLNMAIGEHSLNFQIYYLSLINSNGVFYKYLVKNVIVSSNVTRCYDITSIFRPFDKQIDDSIKEENGNTISYVSYSVSKIFTISNKNGETCTNIFDTDVIHIIDKYVGFVRYEGVSNWINKSCDRHYVAFSTDKKIDKLLEADVFYRTQSSYRKYLSGLSGFDDVEPFQKEFGQIKDNYSYLTLTDNDVVVSVGSSGLIGNDRYFSYSWNGIQTVSDFVSSVNVENMFTMGIFDVAVSSQITEEGLRNLENMQWVLSFDATDYTMDYFPKGGCEIHSTIVSDVSILRLKFESSDILYNLGVVDNMQSGDGIPDNEMTTTISLANWFKINLVFLGVILLVVVLSPVLPVVFKIIWFVVKTIIKVVWWILTLPFKLLGAIFKKRE